MAQTHAPEQRQRRISLSRGAKPSVCVATPPAWRPGLSQPLWWMLRRGLWGPRSKGLAQLLIVGSGDAKPKILVAEPHPSAGPDSELRPSTAPSSIRLLPPTPSACPGVAAVDSAITRNLHQPHTNLPKPNSR